MTSRIFEEYLEEHKDICASITRSIDVVRERSGDARRAAQAEADDGLQKGNENVQQMELEARTGSGKEMITKAKACKAELATLKTTLRQAAASVPASARAELLGGSSGDEAGDDQRATLLRMGETMQAGTSKLHQAHKTILEAEEMGASIMGDLKSQRETMLHATGALQRANEGLDRSKRMLNAIARRARDNKMIMWALIVMLFVGVLFLGYVQFVGFGGGGGTENVAAVVKGNSTPAKRS